MFVLSLSLTECVRILTVNTITNFDGWLSDEEREELNIKCTLVAHHFSRT